MGKLLLNDYRNKLLGCWMGKNIGGTLGAPFECKRGVFDVDFYTHELTGEPLPNDDLDLQLVWLNAAEKYGKFVDAKILGEYWLSHITPNWAEYGAGKNNMRMGIIPPLSGLVNNEYCNSCGSFIRSEIWACLAPGHPEIAVKHAYEDAIVDHSYEGVYAEVFCAAVESAAFVESDKFKLIDIGLSYIPDDCAVTVGVKNVLNSFNEGVSWQEARKRVLTKVPGSFGMLGTTIEDAGDEVPVGAMGFDAPSNIGIMIIGWLYGEDDLGKSLCIAVSCGEDADCTAATLGSIWGIINGRDKMPQKWIEPIGDGIKTVSINLGDRGIKTPKTITELTERILKLTPVFLGGELCDFVSATNGYSVDMLESDELFNTPKRLNTWVYTDSKDILKQCPYIVEYDFIAFKAYFDYQDVPFVQQDKQNTFKLTIENKFFVQQWINIKWHLPEGWTINPPANSSVCLEQYHCNVGKTEVEFVVTPNNLTQSKYELVVELSSNGRHSKGFIPVVLMSR